MTYEPKDVSLRVVGFSAAILLCWIGGSLLVAAWVYRNRTPVSAASATWGQTPFTSGPAAKTSLEQEWTALARDTDVRLDTYGWVDRKQGIARLPIDRAIEILAARDDTPSRGRKGGP